jgi:hypothetical protein
MLVGSALGFGQVYYGGITGVVSDSSGAVIPSVQVTITNTGTSTVFHATTTQAGEYSVGGLIPGSYSVKTEASGFQSEVVNNVQVIVGSVSTVNVTMQVGQVTQQVEVSAAAPVLDTANATVGTVVGNQAVTEMPLNGRSFTSLLQLVPGSVATGNSFMATGSNYQISGNRSGSNMFQMDGVYNNEEFFGQYAMQPSIDSIQEFQVQTNITSAEYGRAAGAAIAVATKSGTNSLHGDIFEFLRNDALDANQWFNNYFNVPKTAYKWNQFGGTAGGPIYIPHLYDGRNKAFWFFSYEGIRNPQNSTNFGTVPTTEELSGNFTSNLGPQLMTCGPNSNQACYDALGQPVLSGEIYNPATTRQVTAGQIDPVTGLVAQQSGYVRSQFSCNGVANVICPSLISPITTAYAKIMFPATNVATANNIINTAAQDLSQYQFSTRVDWAFGSKVNTYFRVSDQHDYQLQPNGIPATPNQLYNTFTNAVASATYSISPTAVFDFKSAFNRSNLFTCNEDPAPGAAEFISNYPINGTPLKSTLCPMYPSFFFGSFYTDVSQSGNPFITNLWQELGNLTLIRGKHQIKIGGEYEHLNAYYDGLFTSQFTYNQVPTEDPLTLSGGPANEVASYLLALPNDGLHNIGYTAAYFHQNTPGVYVQDNWKPTPKLTVNAGLRWEYNQWPFDKYNHLGTYYIETNTFGWAGNNVATGQQTPTAPRSLMNPDYTNFAPRIGLAYQLQPNTVIRAGFGVFYNGDYAWAGQGPRGQWPYGISSTVNSANNIFPTVPMTTMFPTDLYVQYGTPPSEQHIVARNNRTPYTEQWNIGVQQQLTRDLLLEVDYVGNNGKNLSGFFNVNDPLPGPGTICPPTPCSTVTNPKPRPATPYAPTLGSMSENANNATSHYNGLQVKLDKRFSNGLQGLVTYTWSHLLDTPSGDNYGGTSPENDLCRYCDYGNSANNFPQIFTAQFLYDLPVGKGRRWMQSGSKVAQAILGGWETTGIYHYNSGFPINLSVASDIANVGQRSNNQRPNYVGGAQTLSSFVSDPLNPANGIRILNVDAYANPAQYTYGDVGRYSTIGPHYTNLDFGLYKNFPFSEGKRSVQFRAEFFNFFNIHDFAGPPSFTNSVNTTCCEANNSSFGDTTSVWTSSNGTAARVIQFALKLYF